MTLTAMVPFGGASAAGKSDNADSMTIFAAASLSDVMNSLIEAWQKQPGNARTRLSLGASGVIARQIEAGADADVFISANRKWTDYLAVNGFSSADNTIVAKNSLVMVLPCSQMARKQDLSSPYALRNFLMTRRFAMADPNISPAGEYTKIALKQLAIWDGVSDSAAYAGNVRLTLLLTERGGLPGFVYTTDANKSTLACQAMQLPASSYPPIEYVALVPHYKDGDLRTNGTQFINWLKSQSAQDIWRKHGFMLPDPK